MRIVRYDWPTQQWGPKCEISDLAGGPSAGRGFPGLVAGCAAPRGAAGGCIWLFASAGGAYPPTFTSRLTTGRSGPTAEINPRARLATYRQRSARASPQVATR